LYLLQIVIRVRTEGERGSSASAVMEEWTDLAKSVLGTLFTVGCDVHWLIGAVDTTRSKLAALAIAVERRRVEAARGDIDEDLVTFLGGVSASLPFQDLDRAIRELARLNALHARADHASHLYGGHAGLVGGNDEPWQSWKQHHDGVLGHAEAALRRLRTAASRARAVEDAIRSARSCALGSPRWDNWMEAAVQLVVFARISAVITLNALGRMHKEVAQEFYYAWKVLDR
jgi:hypothetical protein